MRYSAETGALVITADDGEVVYRGKPEGRSVTSASSVPSSTDGVVLYDYYRLRSGQRQNLVRITSDLRIVWRAQSPSERDAYVGREGKIYANSWEGVAAWIDIDTGQVLEMSFTK